MLNNLLITDVEYCGEIVNLLVNQTGFRVTTDDIHQSTELINGKGLTALPGFVDIHVHFRDPGLTAKEDILTGSRAAAAGGYTIITPEPNTRPVIDNTDEYNAVQSRMNEMPVTVLQKAAVTLNQQGIELTDLSSLNKAGAPSFSDDGEPIVDENILIEAFKLLDTLPGHPVITAHCEETPKSSIKVNKYLGSGNNMMREPEIVMCNISALRKAGCGRLHIQHVSMAETVKIIADAKSEGLSVTAEVAPHHLWLCDSDIMNADPNYKMNPPLRSREDMLAMRQALADSIIDIIATDHAPHTAEEKAAGWEKAPFGITGLETAFPLIYQLVIDNVIPFSKLAEILSLKPESILFDNKKVNSGITLVDLKKKWVVESFYSKSSNSPFIGRNMTGKVIYTINSGKVITADGAVIF
jgi:dihydroorotase